MMPMMPASDVPRVRSQQAHRHPRHPCTMCRSLALQRSSWNSFLSSAHWLTRAALGCHHLSFKSGFACRTGADIAFSAAVRWLSYSFCMSDAIDSVSFKRA